MSMPVFECAISDIILGIKGTSSFYYCEKNLELRHEYPLPPTQRMIDGESGYEAVLSITEPLTREGAVEATLEERERTVCLYEL